jgi:hypothetical protein
MDKNKELKPPKLIEQSIFLPFKKVLFIREASSDYELAFLIAMGWTPTHINGMDLPN